MLKKTPVPKPVEVLTKVALAFLAARQQFIFSSSFKGMSVQINSDFLMTNVCSVIFSIDFIFSPSDFYDNIKL